MVESTNDILKKLDITERAKKSDFIKGDTKEENLILESLQQGPLYIDKIIENTKLQPQSVASAVSILEIKGK